MGKTLGSATIETREVMGDICIDNVLNGVKGEKLRCALEY